MKKKLLLFAFLFLSMFIGIIGIDAGEIKETDYIYISETPSVLSLDINKTHPLEVIFMPEDSTDREVVFYSTDDRVAAVDRNGLITAKKKGTAIIYVETANAIDYVKVLVGSTIKEQLDYTVDKLDLEYISRYDQIYDFSSSSIENVIENIALNLDMQIFNDFNLYGSPKIEYKENKFYIKVCYSETGEEICSEERIVDYKDYEINIDVDKFYLETDETKNIGIKYTKGVLSDLVVTFSDPAVASYEDGVIKGLKPGITNIYFGDKYNKYYSTISVTVDYEDYYNSVFDKYFSETIDLQYPKWNSYCDSLYNYMGNETDIYDFIDGSDFSCISDGIKRELNISMSNDDYSTSKTITFTPVGFDFDQTYYYIVTDEEIELFYNIYGSENVSSIESLNPTICSYDINTGKAKGLSTGLCTIKYTTNSYYAYVHLIVNKDETMENAYNILSQIPSEILLSDSLLLGSNIDEKSYPYNMYINGIIEDSLNLNNNYSIGTSSIVNNELLVTVFPNYYFVDEENEYFFSIPTFATHTSSRRISIMPHQVSSEEHKIIEKINDLVDDEYILNTTQSIKYLLNEPTDLYYRFSTIIDYSDFADDLYSACKTCTYEVLDYYLGGVAIKYKGEVIHFDEHYFDTNFTITANLDDASPEEKISLIKEKVLEVYLEDNNITSTDEEVIVTPLFDNEYYGEPYYNISIGDIEFDTIVYFEKEEYDETRVNNLKVTSNSYSSIKLNWDELNGSTSYKVYRATSSTGTYKYLATVTDNEYVNTGVYSGKTYYYRVRGNNGTDNSLYSSKVSGKARPDETTLSLTSVGYSSVKLGWTKVSGATGYRIYRATSENGDYSHIKTITSGSTLSYTDTGRTTNKTYYYKVKAIRTKSGYTGYSYYSNVISGKPTLKTPVATGYSDYYRYAKISWNEISGAHGYNIYRSETEDGDGEYIGYTTSTLYYDKTAEEGVTYYYQVRAYRKISGSKKYGERSNNVAASRLGDTISVSITSGYDYITLTIDEVPNAAKYYIYRSTSRNGKYSLITTKTNEDVSEGKLVYTNTKRTYNKTYYYKVKVFRKTYSDYSAVKAIKTRLESPTFNLEVGTSPKEISMTINKVNGATGYEIYSSETENGDYEYLKRTNSLTYSYELTQEEYEANKTYYCKVIPYRTVNGKRIYGNESAIQSITLE